MSKKYEIEVGVDVAKKQLCVCIKTKIKSYPNNASGIRTLLADVSKAGKDSRKKEFSRFAEYYIGLDDAANVKT